MPATQAWQLQHQILIGDEISELLLEALAVIAGARRRHEVVENGLGVRTGDHVVDARELAEA